MSGGRNMQDKGVAWLGIAGAVAVLAAGSILLNMNTEATSAKHEDGSQQVQAAPSAFKQGDAITIPANVPLFSKIKDSSVAADLMKIQYYTFQTEKPRVDAVRGEWIRISDMTRGEQWLPAWYATEKGNSFKATDPYTFSLRPEGELSLVPESPTSWKATSSLTKKAYIVAEWKDWYGVSLAPRSWAVDFYAFRHSLVWIKSSDVMNKQLVQDGWMKADSKLSTSQVRHLTDIRLERVRSESQVRRWLGEPEWIEHSRNLKQTGEPMSVGETWRYEREDGHLLVTFTPGGKLEQFQWQVKRDPASKADVDTTVWRPETYDFTLRTVGDILPRTLAWHPEWTNQGDTDYTYLQAANDDVLLLKGDDGGFSGMYNKGSVYALNRHTGEKLWQIDTGFGRFQTELDASREYVTVYTNYDPKAKNYVDQIRHIRLKDGKVMWKLQPEQGDDLNNITAAANVVVVEDQVQSGGKKARITVLNTKNGKTLWTMNLSGEYRLLNEGANDPYVLYWNKNKLIAAEPLTGKVAWSKPVKKSTLDDLQYDPYFDGIQRLNPFAAAPNERWMLLEQQWVLIDLDSGKELAKFTARIGQRFEVLNDGRLLIRENKNGQNYGDVQDFTTTLYDPKSNKKLWSVVGRADRGLVEGERLYVVLNGYPAALDYNSGNVLWNVKHEGKEVPMLLNQGSYVLVDDQLLLPWGDDLLALDKNTGKISGRIHDVVIGAPEHRDRDAKNGTLNRIGDEIYIGSANGRFSLYSAETLSANISR